MRFQNLKKKMVLGVLYFAWIHFLGCCNIKICPCTPIKKNCTTYHMNICICLHDIILCMYLCSELHTNVGYFSTHNVVKVKHCIRVEKLNLLNTMLQCVLRKSEKLLENSFIFFRNFVAICIKVNLAHGRSFFIYHMR